MAEFDLEGDVATVAKRLTPYGRQTFDRARYEFRLETWA